MWRTPHSAGYFINFTRQLQLSDWFWGLDWRIFPPNWETDYISFSYWQPNQESTYSLLRTLLKLWEALRKIPRHCQNSHLRKLMKTENMNEPLTLLLYNRRLYQQNAGNLISLKSYWMAHTWTQRSSPFNLGKFSSFPPPSSLFKSYSYCYNSGDTFQYFI